MSLNIVKSVGTEKLLTWEIVKVLSANNPGHDFGVNPKNISDELALSGFDATPIEIGHALKKMGFCEVATSGKRYRTIYIKRLKELEYELIGNDSGKLEAVKPTLIYMYFIGYDDTNKEMQKYHDNVPEPLRIKIGKWFCQTPMKEIEDYIEKCKVENLISKKVLDAT
jgi:hypothetical protein